MNKRTLTETILAGILAATVTAGCTDPKEEMQYVRVDTAACTFLSHDNLPLTIEVQSSGKWEAEPLSPWIHVDERTEDSFTISVEDNESYTETRNGTIAVKAGDAIEEVIVRQLEKGNDSPTYRMYGAYDMGAAMSPEGRYCYGTRHVIQPDGSFLMYPTFFNLDTGAVTEVGPLLYGSPLILEKPMAVTDQGIAFIYGTSNSTVAITVEGDYFEPETPEGYSSPNIQGVSADGRYWVGYCWKDNTAGHAIPVLWTDGKPEPLEMPATSYRGEESTMCLPRGISHDGSIISGTQWENFDCGMVYWKNGKVEIVGKDIYHLTPVTLETAGGETVETNMIDAGIYSLAEIQKMSPNGKWIAGSYREESIDERGMLVQGTTYAAFYNTATERTTIFRDYPDCKAITVTDEGIGVIANGTEMMTSGFVVEVESGIFLGTCLEYIREKFGITVTSGYISYLPPCGDRCLGTMMNASAAGVSFTRFSVSPRTAK